MNFASGLPTPPLTAPGPSQPSQTAHDGASLESLLDEITTSRDPAALNQHLRTFGAKEARETILASLLPGGQDPLTVLDMRRNTLGCLYILSARLNAISVAPPPMHVVHEFCREFNPEQARLAPERITLLGKGIIRTAESAYALKTAIPPLYDLLIRAAPSPAHLTPLHALFVRACVRARHFSAALPVLAHAIMDVAPQPDVHYNDHLVYHYAGGVALAALHRWNAAAALLELVVSAPAQIPAALQMDALKKLVLVQLIAYGKVQSLPKYTHPTLPRLLKSTPYAALARAYPSHTATLAMIVEKEEKHFAADTNLGLVRQTLERAPRWSIKKLTETYLTLSLSEIGREIGVADEDAVRALVVRTIETGEIDATLTADGAVTFADPAPAFARRDVEAALGAAQAQGLLLAELDRGAARSKEFLSKALKNRDDAWGGDEDGFRGERGAMWADESLF